MSRRGPAPGADPTSASADMSALGEGLDPLPQPPRRGAASRESRSRLATSAQRGQSTRPGGPAGAVLGDISDRTPLSDHPLDQTVILATGYQPDVDYLAGLGALNADRWRIHCRGRSLTVPGLGYVGLPGQTGPASATVRGSGPDARRVTRWLRRSLAHDPPIPAECRVPALAKR